MMNVEMRWLIRRDFSSVLRIEQESFQNPWLEEDFVRCLRQKNCTGLVAEYNEEIIGFAVYELSKAKLQIANLAVDQQYRRMGVGRAIINRLIEKLSQQNRSEIFLEVCERNLSGQLFFKSMNFLATNVIRNSDSEDYYVMKYTSPKKDPVKNRLEAYI